MQIPDYRAKALLNRIKRIADFATCNSSDTRTLNALRLLKEDVRWLNKKIDNDCNETPKTPTG